LAFGAAVCAVLWSIGLPELGWLGFLAAAFVWPAVQQALGSRPSASGSDGGRWWSR